MFKPMQLAGATAIALAASLSFGSPARAQDSDALRIVMHADLKIVDPIWTTAYMSRNYGYMVYDTLFALDDKLEVQPQMVDSYEISDDGLTYTFTLRDGLLFHNGDPVTSADAIASVERWGKVDAMGQLMMEFVDAIEAVDDQTFKFNMKQPYGLVLLSLAKPSSNVPFIMPKAVAETPPGEQITDYTGSGPFVFAADEWEPGSRAVFTRFEDYVPRDEPASWAAGGKVAKVDRVEWVNIPDKATAVNALINGEIDILEQPPHDLLPLIDTDDNIQIHNTNPLGLQYMFRMNWLHPPFDNQTIRRAALAALNQEDFVAATIGNPEYYLTCPAMFICDTPFATDAGGEILMSSDFAQSKRLLEEAGYDGTPVVLMQSTDLQVLTNLAPVAKALLEQGGFTVDMQSMDWQTLVSRRAKKEPPSENGWNAFLTSWVAADVLNPITAGGLKANGDQAWFGWPTDEQIEKMRLDFALETDLEKQKELAKQIQERALEIGMYGYVGQYLQPMAWRSDRVSGVLDGPAPFFWNVEKTAG